MYNYNLTSEAFDDLGNIQDYIANDNPIAAADIIDEFFLVFSKLADNPFMGHMREDLTFREVRFFAVHSYLIIYDATTNPISIIRVLSGYRDISTIL